MDAMQHTFPFLRLPAEFRLKILEYSTLEIKKILVLGYAQPDYNMDGIVDLLSAFTHCDEYEEECFHPSYSDLARIHFPEEAKIVDVLYFKEFCLRWFDPRHEDEEWRFRVEHNYLDTQRDLFRMKRPTVGSSGNTPFFYTPGLGYHGTGMQYLNLLSLIAAKCIAAMNGLLGCRWMDSMVQQNVYHGLLLLYRFNGGHVKWDLGIRNVTWHQFITCGALATCIKHFIFGFPPMWLEKFFPNRVFPPVRGKKSFGLPIGYDAGELLNIGLHGFTLSLTPSRWDVAIGGSYIPSSEDLSDCPLEPHRLWFLERRHRRTAVVNYRAIQRDTVAGQRLGTFSFDSNEVLCPVIVLDGLHLLHDNELPNPFGEFEL